MSATALARLVDDAAARGAFVTEGADVVVTSNLGAAEAASLSRGVDEAGWTVRIRDGAGGEWAPADLDEAFAPFVVTVTKPAQPDGTLAVLTAAGLRQQLRADAPQRRWRVGVLAAPIRTWDLLLIPWDAEEQVEAELPTVNPRRLVREVGAERMVPTSLARWLLRRDQTIDLEATGQRIWAIEADRRIAASLANEIDPDTRELMFRGPPRLTLKLPGDDGEGLLADLFPRLQEAGSWIYENERETELRHTLLATEIARSGGGGDAFAQLATSLRPSLDGARIAYEMSVSGMSADTLKALADLRKAVTDETAKVTEATRQTIAALTGALAIGVGLVAAKLTTATDPLVLAAVMAVAALYVILVTASGAQFVLLQRKVRSDWQATLYRFLPPADYRRLVTKPAGRAEFAFWTAAVIGVVATALLALAVAKAEPKPKPPAAVPDRTRSEPGAPARRSAAAHARSDRGPHVDRPPMWAAGAMSGATTAPKASEGSDRGGGMSLSGYGFELDFLPVGTGAKSGDAISMRIGIPGTSVQSIVVVDGGTLEAGRSLVDHVRRSYGDPVIIDHVVSTHPDGDHVSGLREVLDQFHVGTLWIHQPWLYAASLVPAFKYGWTADGLERRLKECFATSWELCQTATARGTLLAEPYQGQVIAGMQVLAPSLRRYLALVPQMSRTPAERAVDSIARSLTAVARTLLSVLESWSFETLGTPRPGDTSPTNETSVVMFGDFGEQRIMLTADAGVEALDEAFSQAAALGLPAYQPNLVQMPHHGSRRNISPALLDRLLGPILEQENGLRGGWAVASASAGDEHHPRRVVQNAFRRRGYLCAKTHGGMINYRHLYPLRDGLGPIQPEPFHSVVED